MDYPISAFSWTLLTDKIAVKKLDKSAFLHHGTGIPKELKSHFYSELPDDGASVLLTCFGVRYEAHLQHDTLNSRVRLFWKSDFDTVLRNTFPDVQDSYTKDVDVESPPLMKLTTTDDLVFLVELVSPPGDSEGWSSLELEVAVLAYFQMLNKERQGKPYNKAEINHQLRDVILSNRSKGSVEFRMANISSVLEQMCHPTINGYKPRGNVGADVAKSIEKVIYDHNLLSPDDYSLTADTKELNAKVSSLLEKGVAGKPNGQKAPKKTPTKGTSYERDPLVKAWVLQNAEGMEAHARTGDIRLKKYGHIQ